MAVTQKVTLYNNKFTVPPVINAVQNDTDRQVEAYFGDFTLQVGMTGKLSFIRSDGTHYEVSATLSTVNNTATAELDHALTQVGVTQAQLKITDSGNVGSTFTFMIKVQPDVAGVSEQQDGWSVDDLVDYLATSYPVSFTVTLASASWSAGEQTVQNANFVVSGYTYFVNASPDDTYDYQDSRIYADDVETDGEMTFHCDDTPANDLVVNIVRMKLMP